MRTILFPGSFRPFTIGHANLVERALQLFDRVVIAIGENIDKPSADLEERLEAIQAHYADHPRVKVISYHTLTADVVQKENAACILRGIRNAKDLEYENQIAQANYTLFGVDTLYLLSDPELKEVSSSLVRDLQKYGKDISALLPRK